MAARPRVYVTIEGYAVEGGLDVAWGPATCFASVIALGRAKGPGEADGLWARAGYESAVDLAATLGLDGVRLTTEWARIEPVRGRVDEAALARYVAVIARARERGLGVTIALFDAAWPAWLGAEAWLLPWVRPHVLEQARRVVDAIDDEGVRVQIFTDRSSLVRGYLDGGVPPWRQHARRDAARVAASLASIDEELRGDPAIGPRVVTSSATVSLAAGLFALRAARSSDVDELYVRSLFAGHGPTRSGFGLLARERGALHVVAREELLEALR